MNFSFDLMAGEGPHIFGQSRTHGMLVGSVHYGWAMSSRREPATGEALVPERFSQSPGLVGPCFPF
jgi:hypothetical protein